MSSSELRLIKNAVEYLDKDDFKLVPPGARGIYVLYKKRRYNNTSSNNGKANKKRLDVVYVGMASKSIKARLATHKRYKGDLWTHFSAFEVWDNISNEEIGELEGLFRHLYKHDSRANALNKQKGYRKLRLVREKTKSEWV